MSTKSKSRNLVETRKFSALSDPFSSHFTRWRARAVWDRSAGRTIEAAYRQVDCPPPPLALRTREWAIYSKVLRRWRMKANGESGLGNQRASERAGGPTAAAITTETWPYTTLHFKTTSRGGIVFHWAAAAPGKRLQKGLFMGSKGEAAQNILYHEIA